MIELWNKFNDWVNDLALTLNINPYIIMGAIGFLVLLILILIIALISGASKKKVKKDNKGEPVEINENSVELTEEDFKDDVEQNDSSQEIMVESKNEEVDQGKEEKPQEIKDEIKEESTLKKQEVLEENKENITKEEPKKATRKKAAKKEKEDAKPEQEEKPEKQEKALGKYTISQEGLNYRYRLFANNGELMGVSELYSSEDGCRKGIETLKKNALLENVDYVQDKHDLFSFRVMSKQGRCLLTSANYETKQRAQSASESLLRFTQTNKIVMDESEDHYEIEEFKEEVNVEEHGKFRVEIVNDSFVYQLYANNGRIIATSQQYASKKSCLEAIEKFRALVYEGKFYIFKDKNSKFQYKLYNKQKRLVLAGEVYDNKANAVSAITSIKRFAKLAEIVE